LNDPDKWDRIRNKLDESACSLFCFQETKKEVCDLLFMRKFAPKRFDSFVFSPSDGASGGILVGWSSKIFSMELIDNEPFALKRKVTSVHNSVTWTLITVYGPTREPARTNFVAWLYSLHFEIDDLAIIMGDFIFYRSSSNRNLPGGYTQDMLLFNDMIHHLGLIELPIKGRSYTWSNMHD
jgi:hypothetical protein